MKATPTDFAKLVTGFLTDYLPLQRNYSGNTILSYRDALKLFVVFLTEYKNISLLAFTLEQFKRELVVEYLAWLKERGSGVSTTNQRLAAMKTFAEYAGIECIEYLSPLQNVQSIKTKKSASGEIKYLTVEQTRLVINAPDINTTDGLRHRTVLTLLYDSGCRVQELSDLKICDINTVGAATIRLHGKGNKYRTITISKNTADLIEAYISRQRRNALADQPLITNRFGKQMTRDGVDYIVKKYADEMRKKDPSIPEKPHPHSFRHSKAMHLLAAGTNIVYIRDFLGHEDISTTMIYCQADNRLKEEAINKLAPKITEETNLPSWSEDTGLMAFLRSLK